MKTKKNITLFDKIMFPILNTLMLLSAFIIARDLLKPSTALEYVAVILITVLFATPIANMNRKEIMSLSEIEVNENQKDSRTRKSA